MRIFPKNTLITKKRPLKVISTTFLLREVQQLAVYQLLSNCQHKRILWVTAFW